MTDELNGTTEARKATTQVEVRRNVALSGGIGGVAALLTVAFAARAFTGGTALDWLAFGVLALVTVAHLAVLLDSRAPLLVADDHGVRLRDGARWQGIAWADIDCLEHLPRRGLLRDGHLLVDGYDEQQLVVPLTLATRVSGIAAGTAVSDVLADLAAGRADVVEVVPGLAEEATPAPAPAAGQSGRVPTLSDLYRDDEPASGGPATEPTGIAARVAAGLSMPSFPSAPTPHTPADRERLAERLAEIRSTSDVQGLDLDAADVEHTDEIPPFAADVEDTGEIEVDEVVETDDVADADHGDRIETEPEQPIEPGRPTVLPARVEVQHTSAVRAVLPQPEAHDATEGPSNETVVLEDLAIHPANEPVIGPQLASARERLRLTVDQLSDRTRIRPHVIEAIEVDDFGPCGGDFYARGHLRTIARVLGVDANPLIEQYDDSYAHAPVDPRRVFESELAGGLAAGNGGALRAARGGRNWSVLIAAVMGAILVWSVAQLVLGAPEPVGNAQVLNQSGGILSASKAKGDPVKLSLTAAGGGAQLVVRDAAGDIVFDGNLAFGQTSKLSVVAPVRIWSSDGSVTYALGDAGAQALGETGVEVSKTLIAR